jgi:hypothetical protein
LFLNFLKQTTSLLKVKFFYFPSGTAATDTPEQQNNSTAIEAFFILIFLIEG